MFRPELIKTTLTTLEAEFVKDFVIKGCDRVMAQRVIRTASAIQGMYSCAAVDCIKESNSIEECVRFAELNPTPYVLVMANARIRQLSSGKKSIVTGGHETNE